MPLHKSIKYPSLLKVNGYQPVVLIDYLISTYKLRNDAGLSRAIGAHPAVICKIRHKNIGLSSEMILRLHDVFQLSIHEIRQLAGIPVPPELTVFARPEVRTSR